MALSLRRQAGRLAEEAFWKPKNERAGGQWAPVQGAKPRGGRVVVAPWIRSTARADASDAGGQLGFVSILSLSGRNSDNHTQISLGTAPEPEAGSFTAAGTPADIVRPGNF